MIHIFGLIITFIYPRIIGVVIVAVVLACSVLLSPCIWDDGLLLVWGRVAADLHGHPLAAEDERGGRGAVQGLQLLLCNMSSLICQTVVMFVITVMIFNLKVSYHSLDHFV